MAETKKKSTYSGSRVADKKKNTKKPAKKPAKTPKADTPERAEQTQMPETAAKKPFRIRREIWAAASLFVAFVACLSVCGLKGWFISAYEWLSGTLIGYGANVLPLVFMSAGIILLVKRHGKARLKVTAVMLTPWFASAIFHVTKTAPG